MADADAMRLYRDQLRQRQKRPRKVAQDILHSWCGSNLAFIDPQMVADLVKLIEAAIVAERAPNEAPARAAEQV